VRGGEVIARDAGSGILYAVAKQISPHLIRASDLHLLGDTKDRSGHFLIVLSRELSRPGSMGQGYCGAGYEDYLLLLELRGSKMMLRDELLLQSCLKSISMFIDHGDDDPAASLIRRVNGSFEYRMVEDDYDKRRILTVKNGRFRVALMHSLDDDERPLQMQKRRHDHS
jgi:hypothetical protein